MNRDACERCRFYAKYVAPRDNYDGMCRRFPPIPFLLEGPRVRIVQHKKISTVFPEVFSDGWCGEFQAKQ